MENGRKTKHENLKKAGLFNPDEEKIKDPLFLEHPEFFDPCDTLQVRYEVLRSHRIESDTITGICKRFGISRQTFYTLGKEFEQEGTAGLLPKKPGPRGPRKLTVEVLAFVEKSLEEEEAISAARLKTLIQERCGVSLHKRTIEKVCKEFRVKKTPVNELLGQCVKRAVIDPVRFRYEELRTAFIEGDGDGYPEGFMLFGMYGLFGESQKRAYVVEVYEAPSARWSGRTDSRTLVLQEAFMQVIGIEHLPGSYHS